MVNKFTQKAQLALNEALSAAEELGHSYVGTEHLLLGLMIQKESIAARILTLRGAKEKQLRQSIIDYVGIGTKSPVSAENMTPRLRYIIENASKEAERTKTRYVGTEHLLLSLMNRRDSVGVRLLEAEGILATDIKSDLAAYLGSSPNRVREEYETDSKKSKKQTLLLYGRDLTELAAKGKCDPVLCRDKETERLIRILCRRSKNNPCIIGDPGVGKTAVVEGLAQRIASGNVPPQLCDKKIITLDISSMLAGAKYRGEFEDRIKGVIEEVRQNPSIILFVDEMHIMVGAGAAEGAIDASNILKPSLARGEIRMIGATTPDEYRTHIEKDSAFERRFQPLHLEEPTEEQALCILRGLKSGYEEHHGVALSEDALQAAVHLSVRYIHDRFLPDKAIDLIDEAAAKLKLSEPPSEELNRKMLAASQEEAIKSGDFERASLIGEERRRQSASVALLPHAVPTLTAEDIAALVSEQTGIPAVSLEENELKRLRSLEAELKARVIGQDNAVNAVASAIRRSRTGLSSPNRPTGSFLFLGSTGVGKTQLCRALADILFDGDSSLIKLDMSEYMEKHSISKLIGSPPGYVGYGEGGFLTEKLRRRPYCVVLFDEIEKAHPDVFNLLLQILEDGRLTDSLGRSVDFSSAVIVMTSNILSSAELSRRVLGFGESPQDADSLRKNKKLSEYFSPELLNRIDEIILFSPLGVSQLTTICKQQLDELCDRAKASGLSISIEPSVYELIASRAHQLDQQGGARSLRREITAQIESPLSEYIIESNLPISAVNISTDGDRIVLDASHQQ